MVIVRSLLGVVFSPDIAWAVHDGSGKPPDDRFNSLVQVASGSVAIDATGSGSAASMATGTQWLVWGEQIKTERAVRRSGLSTVPPLSFLLLCTSETPLLQKDTANNGSSSGRGLLLVSPACPALRFRVAGDALSDVVLLEELHSVLRCLFEEAMSRPEVMHEAENCALVKVVGKLLAWSESHASRLGFTG